MARNAKNNKIKGNNFVGQVICADCSATDAEWASINRGIILCAECCSVHRSLGRHVSQIKSCNDKDWHPHTWSMVSSLSTGGGNSVWEHTLLDPGLKSSSKKKPQPSDPVHPDKANFIRAKHQMLSFVIQPPGGGDDGCKDASGGGADEDFKPDEEPSQELHSSVRTGNLEISLRLLSQGADPNYYHKDRGNYPLHVAASAGQAEQAELLLAYGALHHFLDSSGNSAAQCASAAGYPELSSRLNDVQYEVVQRLVSYLSDQYTNTVPHSQPYCRSSVSSTDTLTSASCDIMPSTGGGWFLPPQLLKAYQNDSDQGRKARSKLINLSCVPLEELASDLYDEVDRRELETAFASTNNNNNGSSVPLHHHTAAEHCTTPFLPVNPMLSSTRNQARQKLARLKDSEFCSLLVDLLLEVRRRAARNSNGSSVAPAIATSVSSAETNARHPPDGSSLEPDHNSQYCHDNNNKPNPPPLPYKPQPTSSFFLHSPLSPAPLQKYVSSTNTSSYTTHHHSSSMAPLTPITSHTNSSSETSPALHRNYPLPSAKPTDPLQQPPSNPLKLFAATNNPSNSATLGARPPDAPLSLEDLLQECSAMTDSMETSSSCFSSNVRYNSKDSLNAPIPVAPRNSFTTYNSPAQFSNPTVDPEVIKPPDVLSVDSLDVSSEKQQKKDLHLSLNDNVCIKTSPEESPEFYLTFGSTKDGIHPPLSPQSSMVNSSSSFYLRLTSETEGIYPPLSPLTNADSASGSYVPLGSIKSGINPPLTPQFSDPAGSPIGRVPSGINPPLTPQASSICDSTSGSYVPLGSIRSGINPAHTPQYSDPTGFPSGRVPSGINPPLTPQASYTRDSATYVTLGSITSGINPPLSAQASTVDDSLSESYVQIGSIMSGIHPGLSEQGSNFGSRSVLESNDCLSSASLPPLSFRRNQQNNPLYRSYDTVNISSDEEDTETRSLDDDGQVGDTEDATEEEGGGGSSNATSCTVKSKYSKNSSKSRKLRKDGKSVQKRIREGLGSWANRSDDSRSGTSGGGKKDKYSSGFSSDSNISSDDGSSTRTFVGSCSSDHHQSSYTSSKAVTSSSTSQFAAQLSRSIKQKLLSGKSSKSSNNKMKEKRKSEGSNIMQGTLLDISDAIAKSKSLPLKNSSSVVNNRSNHSFANDKSKGNNSKNSSESSKSKFVRTLTMPLKMASQRRQSISRMVLSKSQPTTPEMSRKHRVIQSYTRPRTNTSILSSSGSFSSPSSALNNTLRIRDPLSLGSGSSSFAQSTAGSVRSLFNSKDKNSSAIKHISKPIMVTDPLSFQRLTASTKSLMNSREKNYCRPLVKSYGVDGKPPIASRPAPHHSSDNLNHIHLNNDGEHVLSSYDPPPFLRNSPRVSPMDPYPPSLSSWCQVDSAPLYLEVCDKCRQNVADGLQHPSVWAMDHYLPLGYVRTKDEQDRIDAMFKKKGYRDDCRLQ